MNNLNETLQILLVGLNQIHTIEKSTINYYSVLHKIELDQNPLNCNCHIDQNIYDLIRSNITITGQCQSPIERRNINLIDLIHQQSSCDFINSSLNSHTKKFRQSTLLKTISTMKTNVINT